MTAISHHPKPVNNLPRRSPTENWQRGTIFAATFYRIHDTPKPVKNLPFQSPAKPLGRQERFFQPPVAASTTIREASPAHNMQSLPTQPTTKRNHCFSPVNHFRPYSPANPRGQNETQEPFFQPPVAESTTIPSQFKIFPMTEINHFVNHRLQNPLSPLSPQAS